MICYIFQADQGIASAYNLLCGGGVACTAATAAIVDDTACETEDNAILCTGLCRALADNFINACPADVCLYKIYKYLWTSVATLKHE